MVPSYDPEPSTSSGQCYWLNYLNVFKWHAFHSSPENSSSIYQMPGLHQTSYFNDFQDAVGSSRMDQSFQEDEDAEECDGGAEESDDDIVVTEELMQFLEISMRHKASMKAKKEKAAEDLAKEATSERNAIDDCQHPKEDDSAEKRRLELDILYGRAAPTIHGMETATQLTFNRAVDLFNPPYWPVHPFSIKFQAEN
ncbi:Hypothetical protein NTJ_07161 [Nesidiocoris tenuis]|uniref:Gem-associated protein 8 n=1 Tax=Nesidiocoris tenuis TaxID=355587 RepID=A0ABN7ASN6_9HEMI|nr:Hypothetical protein NTJ_07161 [Nesidiocoris tenuis]